MDPMIGNETQGNENSNSFVSPLLVETLAASKYENVPTANNQIVAIRHGLGISNAIFLTYHEAEKFILKDGNNTTAEFEMFDNMTDAIQYLKKDGSSFQNTATNATTNNMKSISIQDGKESAKEVSSKTRLPMSMIMTMPRNRIKAEANPNRRPTKHWSEMFEAYKKYVENKKTTVVKLEEEPKLYKWIKQQETEYKFLMDGKSSSMFQDKIEMLQKVGFQFKYLSIQESYQALYQFKDKHGVYPSSNHPVLGNWIEKHRNAAKKFTRNSDDISYFDMRRQEFQAMGIVFDQKASKPLTESEQKDLEYEKNWDDYLRKFISHAADNDNQGVSKEEDPQLYGWISKQNKEYQLMQDGKTSTMTASRLDKLSNAEFQLKKKAYRQTKWTDRLKQLAEYKDKYGNLRIPSSHKLLGKFVNRQRDEYKRLKAGKPSSMTQERIQQLQELGFVFSVLKTQPQPRGKRLTWDERFAMLVKFKEDHNHCNVPQKHMGLGEWAHAQRKGYKLFQEGKTTAFNAERLMKLVQIGFVFNGAKNRSAENSNSSDLLLQQNTFQMQNPVGYNYADSKLSDDEGQDHRDYEFEEATRFQSL